MPLADRLRATVKFGREARHVAVVVTAVPANAPFRGDAAQHMLELDHERLDTRPRGAHRRRTAARTAARHDDVKVESW